MIQYWVLNVLHDLFYRSKQNFEIPTTGAMFAQANQMQVQKRLAKKFPESAYNVRKKEDKTR